MNTIVENLTGMNVMTDQVIATDLLITAKSGVKCLSIALTESATPEVRAVLKKQLNQALETHEQITAYMMEKGWYSPYDIKQQIQLDLQNAQTALNIPQ